MPEVQGSRQSDNGEKYYRQQDVLRLAGFLLNFLAVLLIAFGAYFARGLAETVKEQGIKQSIHETRLSTIESNRFTVKDWADNQRNINEQTLKTQMEIQRIWIEISKLPEKSPPKYFEDRVDRLEKSFEAHKEKTDAHQTSTPAILKRLP